MAFDRNRALQECCPPIAEAANSATAVTIADRDRLINDLAFLVVKYHQINKLDERDSLPRSTAPTDSSTVSTDR